MVSGTLPTRREAEVAAKPTSVKLASRRKFVAYQKLELFIAKYFIRHGMWCRFFSRFWPMRV
jgi:hypothetical protein